MDNSVLTEIKSFQSSINEKLTTQGDFLTRALKRLDIVEEQVQRPLGLWQGGAGEVKGLAALLSESAEFKSWARAGKGRFAMVVSGREWLAAKTTITSGTVGSSTPGILVPQRAAGIVKPGVRSLRVRELMPNYSTANNAIEFVRENVYTNAASPVAEASAKPEAALTFTIESAPVAHARALDPGKPASAG